MNRRITPIRVVVAIAALTAVASAAVALASITLYGNDFDSRDKFEQVSRLGGGKPCKHSWKNHKAYGFEARRGNIVCRLSTVVVGDAPRPDHEISVKGKISKATPDAIVDDAFFGVALRASQNVGYEFRVFPGTQRWVLLRRPGGTGFPLDDVDHGVIRKFARGNLIYLSVKDDLLTAKINGETVVDDVADGNPLGEVDGRRVLLVYGNEANSSNDTAGVFDILRIGLP